MALKGMRELSKGGRVSALSATLMTAIGAFELIKGFLTGSLGLIGDGIDSFADATTSLAVWAGLRVSRRRPDGKFHFGYFKAETPYSTLAAIFMAGIGLVVIYESYTTFFVTRGLRYTVFAVATALIAATMSTVMLVYKIRVARELGLLSMRTEVVNSATDSLSSIAALVGVTLAGQLGMVQLDSVAGIIIGLFVLVSSYTIIREGSMALMDACECYYVHEGLRRVAMSIPEVKGVKEERLRKLGPFIVGDITIIIDQKMTIGEANEIAQRVEGEAKKLFDVIHEIIVKFEPLQEG